MTELHYDIVGSFLRPAELKKARAEFEEGKIKQEELTHVENTEIRELVQKEIDHGLKIVTDGDSEEVIGILIPSGALGVLNTLSRPTAISSMMKKLVTTLPKLREKLNLLVNIQIFHHLNT